MYPKFEGRFAAVAGLNFTWDSEKPSGTRVISTSMWTTNKPIDQDVMYVLAVKYFVAQGRDGYACLQDDPRVEKYCDIDSALLLKDIVLHSFERLAPNFYPLTQRADLR